MSQLNNKVIIAILIFLLPVSKIIAQNYQYKVYEFNKPGNACYLRYVCYAQNNDYSSTNRPHLFILGKSGESALQTFESDSLKMFPNFHNYLLVYIPNRSGTANDKLFCFDAIVNLVTWQYQCGRENVFLSINDNTINASDIEVAGLQSTFYSVRYASAVLPEKIADNFKENKTAYENTHEDKEDNLGTFYYEEEEKHKDNTAISDQVPTKTYFGPPRAFKYTLSGIVRDKSTGEALPFATVHVKHTHIGVASNADGYFTLSQVPTDTSVLVVSYVGYTTTQVFLSPLLPKTNFQIEIMPAGNRLKQITITGAKEDIVLVKKEDVSVVKMTPKEMEKLPNIGEKDVMRSLQLMPGVSASQESSSGLYVRGGTPDQNLVLFDGFTVYHVDHLYGFFSAFNANAVKDIQLYKGGFESRFGGRLSSVTEITGKDGNQKKFNMGGDISLLSVNAWMEIPVGDKFSSIIAVRRSYKGPIYNKLFDKYSKSSSSSTPTQQGGPGGRRFMQEAEATSYFYDLNGKFTYRPTKKDILTLSIFNGTDKLDNSIDNSNTPSFGGANFSASSTDLTKYGNVGTSIKWSRKWADKLYGNTIISYSHFYSDRDRSMERTSTDASGNETTTKNGVFENNDLTDYSIKSDYQLDLYSFSQLQFGVFGTSYDIHYSYAQNDTTTILDKKNKSLLGGAYLQNKFKLFHGRLIFLPGIRANYFETTGQYYYEPRASASLYLTDNITLKGATGKYYQFANVITREDILSGSKEFWLLADGKNIPVSSANHYIAGISYETTNYLFSTETYYKQVKNLTEYSLRFNPSPSGVKYDENFFSGYGYARGIEFLAQKKTGMLKGWVGYTLGEAINHFDVYSDVDFHANQDVTHEFKIVLLYNMKRWDFSATWVYATGRPYTAPSGAYSVKLLDGSTQDFYTVTSKNGLRLPDYHRGDVSVNYKLLAGIKGDKKRREIGYIGFSIFNVYNHINVWYKTYSIDNGSLVETNVNYTGITPNITLSLKLR